MQNEKKKNSYFMFQDDLPDSSVSETTGNLEALFATLLMWCAAAHFRLQCKHII